jgi:hypothetical protein
MEWRACGGLGWRGWSRTRVGFDAHLEYIFLNLSEEHRAPPGSRLWGLCTACLRPKNDCRMCFVLVKCFVTADPWKQMQVMLSMPLGPESHGKAIRQAHTMGWGVARSYVISSARSLELNWSTLGAFALRYAWVSSSDFTIVRSGRQKAFEAIQDLVRRSCKEACVLTASILAGPQALLRQRRSPSLCSSD